MFNTVSYRRGVIEGCMLYTLGRLGALISPDFFPGWLFILVPLFFLVLQYFVAPVWATYRIKSSKRERLSKRFWLLGPCLAAVCLGLDLVITLLAGLPTGSFGVQQGPALVRLIANGAHHLSLGDFGFYEMRTMLALFALFTLSVVCTRLAQGGFLRFTMPAGGNRVTL